MHENADNNESTRTNWKSLSDINFENTAYQNLQKYFLMIKIYLKNEGKLFFTIRISLNLLIVIIVINLLLTNYYYLLVLNIIKDL
jgi:hypothetical protein